MINRLLDGGGSKRMTRVCRQPGEDPSQPVSDFASAVVQKEIGPRAPLPRAYCSGHIVEARQDTLDGIPRRPPRAQRMTEAHNREPHAVSTAYAVARWATALANNAPTPTAATGDPRLAKLEM
jgi:hypothetical protein